MDNSFHGVTIEISQLNSVFTQGRTGDAIDHLASLSTQCVRNYDGMDCYYALNKIIPTNSFVDL